MPRGKSSQKIDMTSCKPTLQSAKLNLQRSNQNEYSCPDVCSMLCHVKYHAGAHPSQGRRGVPESPLSSAGHKMDAVAFGCLQKVLSAEDTSKTCWTCLRCHKLVTLCTSCILEQSCQRLEATTVSCRAGHVPYSSHDITSSLA